MNEPALLLHADPQIGLPIVYINLDEHVERRALLQAELAAAGVQAQRLSAVRWARLPTEEQARLYSEALNRQQHHVPLVAGEKGCYASHLQACQALLASPHPALVVLEDDVQLTPGFVPALHALLPQLAQWDLVKLIGRPREKLRHSSALTGATALVAYARVPSLTAGHVLTRRGAQKLLASRVPFGRPVDLDLRHWWENGMQVRGLHPAVIALAPLHEQSSIGAKGAGRSLAQRWHKFHIKLMHGFRNAWHARTHPSA